MAAHDGPIPGSVKPAVCVGPGRPDSIPANHPSTLAVLAARPSPGAPEHMSLLLETLRERVLFYDGGMGTQVQARELGPDDFGGKRWEGCIDYLSLTRPDVVESIHAAYFEAAADIVETNSFRPRASGSRSGNWRTRRSS